MKKAKKATPRRAAPRKNNNAKVERMDAFRESPEGAMTSNAGILVNDNQNSLRLGDRGPTLLEDHFLREKITHFDHERIPERVVHARGAAAHGYFQVYEPLGRLTKAGFLNDPAAKTPVFVRFSTVVGSRGSTDLARDVRGFAVRFYTEEGNFDLVGNNIPVFFIQDAIKFPDLIHAAKPEQQNEIPQAQTAHDTFWDFISLMPESMHMVMWAMSDRAIPRSLRMMEGFGVHTFRLVDAKGISRFVKFHWKPKLGVHSVLWDEAVRISGADPDFHRRDLWEAIATGNGPEWELGLQVIEEKDQDKFGIDLLDPTKLIPEELVPVRRVGRMVLDRNPDNFFAETEQVAFHPANIIPGIDFTNDPLLQGRLFSYLDTQLLRLGGPNFHEIPINRPLPAVRNERRDGFMRQQIDSGRANYEPNSLGGGCPFQSKMAEGGFASFPEPVRGAKVRARAPSFFDHYSQATLFYRSQSPVEQNHIVNALRVELGKVETPHVRERMLAHLVRVDPDLAGRVGQGLGMTVPKKLDGPLNQSVPADADTAAYQPKMPGRNGGRTVEKSRALSMMDTVKDTIRTRRVAVLAADGFDGAAVEAVVAALEKQGAVVKMVGPRQGPLASVDGSTRLSDFSFLNTVAALYDAVYLPGGADSVALLATNPRAVQFVRDAFEQCKAIYATDEGVDLYADARPTWTPHGRPPEGAKLVNEEGLVLLRDAPTKAATEAFIRAIAQHRHWTREPSN